MEYQHVYELYIKRFRKMNRDLFNDLLLGAIEEGPNCAEGDGEWWFIGDPDLKDLDDYFIDTLSDSLTDDQLMKRMHEMGMEDELDIIKKYRGV